MVAAHPPLSPLAVQAAGVTKIYEPSPRWMRLLLKSSISEPVAALDNFNLELQAGRLCAIIGPNGAGKSTLFRVLTGLITPTTGQVSIYGMDVLRAGREARELVGFVPAGDQSLYLRMSSVENLLFHGRLQGLPDRQLRVRIDDALDLVGLTRSADRVGFALSSGMRARLLLARALLHRPRLLVLDEPTGTVDPVGAYELLRVIQDLASHDGIAVLISSHRLEEIEALRDRALVMDRGRVLYDGDLEHLRQRLRRPTIRLTFRTEAQAAVARRYLTRCSQLDLSPSHVDNAANIEVTTDLAVGQVLAALGQTATDLTAIDRETPSLRDVLMATLQSEGAPSLGDDLHGEPIS